MRLFYLCACYVFMFATPLLADDCSGNIACYAEVNYSIVPDCPAEITPDKILISVCPTSTYNVEVYSDAALSNLIANPVPAAFIGSSVFAKVTDTATGNFCISTVHITDELSPLGIACSNELVCKDRISVSAGPLCSFDILPSDFVINWLAGETYSLEIFSDMDRTILAPSPIPYESFGDVFYVTVNNLAGNSCFSELIVEDNSPPSIFFFTEDPTISCQDDLASLDLAGALDDCDDEVEVSLVNIEYICRVEQGDSARLTYLFTDDAGNSAVRTWGTCFQDFCVFADFPEDITVDCPDDIPLPEITVEDFDCPRTIVINFADINVIEEPCDITRLYTFFDPATGITYTHSQQITVDETPPQIIPNSITTITYAELEANSFIPYAEAFDECGINQVTWLIQYLEPSDCDRPEFMVRYFITALDNCGNETTRTHDVLVVREGRARIRITGRRDCRSPFTLSADISNLVPPLTYTWTSLNPAWTFGLIVDNAAEIIPSAGSTEITVEVVDALGCIVSDSKRYNCNGRGLRTRSSEISQVVISPNPFSDFLHINHTQEVKQVVIYNLKGQLLHRYFNAESRQQLTLDLSHLQSGMYLIELQYENEIEVHKFVKKE